MKKLLYYSSLIALTATVLQSCQKNENDKSASNNIAVATTLTAAVSEVATAQITTASTEDIQGVAVQKFDGTDASVNVHGMSAPRDIHGRFMD